MTAPVRPHLTLVARAQEFAPAIITLLTLVMIVGFSSLVLMMVPIEFGDTQWRFRSAAMLLTTAPQISFLFAMIAVVAVHSGEHRVVRVAAIGAIVLAAVIVTVVPFYALDFLAIRHLQSQEALGPFTREGLRLSGAGVLLSVGLVWAGIRGVRVSMPDEGADRKGTGHGLIVAQEEPPA